MNSTQMKEKANMVLYAIATLISQLGSTAYTFAISLYVLKLTGSGMSFAVTLAIGIISTVVFNPVAGVMADRMDRKKVAISMDIMSALTMIGLFAVAINGSPSLVVIYSTTFLLNGFVTIYGVAIESAKPGMVHQDRLMTMNSISQVLNASASILGPAVGGLVYAMMDIKTFVWVNAVSFLISALLQLPIKFQLFCTSEEGVDLGMAPKGFINDLKEGWLYLVSRKDLMSLLEVFCMLNFVIGLAINVPMPYIVNHILELSPVAFGIISGALPMGMIVGALAVKFFTDRYSYEKMLMGNSVVLALCMLLMGIGALLPVLHLVPWMGTAWFAGIMGVGGITVSLIDIPLFSRLQSTLPDAVRGRVLSIGIALVKVILPFALILSGALVNYLPAYLLPVVGGTMLVVFCWIRTHANSRTQDQSSEA